MFVLMVGFEFFLNDMSIFFAVVKCILVASPGFVKVCISYNLAHSMHFLTGSIL